MKLKSSLNSMKTKAAPGKQKALPKLKVILANPYKLENKKLSDFEAFELKALIRNEIDSSGMPGREFVKVHHFSVGLGSSLRAISNKKTSCVLISQSIKPKFIISQIRYLTQEKNRSVPVFLVTNLETISEKVFGVKALVVAFPLTLPEKLSEWVSCRTKTTEKLHEIKNRKDSSKTVPKSKVKEKLNLKCIYLRKPHNDQRAFVPEIVVKSEKRTEGFEVERLTGDYISFSKTNAVRMDVDRSEFRKQNKTKVLNVFQQMLTSVQKKRKKSHQPHREAISDELPAIQIEEYDREYMERYMDLKGHKIKRNPKQRDKTKRKQN